MLILVACLVVASQCIAQDTAANDENTMPSSYQQEETAESTASPEESFEEMDDTGLLKQVVDPGESCDDPVCTFMHVTLTIVEICFHARRK